MTRIFNRSNSDLLAIEMVGNNTLMSPQARMAAIEEIVKAWTRSNTFDLEYPAAVEEFREHMDNGSLFAPLR